MRPKSNGQLLTFYGSALVACLIVNVVAAVGVADGRGRANVASSPFRFEQLVVTRQTGSRGLVSFFRLNRRLPYAPRGKYEGEEPGGPRLYAAYLAIDGHYQEGATETMGNDADRDCYTEAIEIDAHEHQPQVGQVVSVSLVIHGRSVLRIHTRVRTRQIGPSVRRRSGVTVSRRDLPYEEAFGCLKRSPS
jgi:hypothetical protein